MISSRYERGLFTQCWKQLENLSAEEEKRLAPALEPAREVSFFQLTPPGIAALRKAGVADILPDPAFVRLFHRTMDANPVDLEHLGNGQAYLERYQAQAAFRQAWEADLSACRALAAKVTTPGKNASCSGWRKKAYASAACSKPNWASRFRRSAASSRN